jgi:alpha-L-fucosidase
LIDERIYRKPNSKANDWKVASGMTQGNSQEWLHHTARMFHVDFHTPAHLKVAENFDAEAFGDAVAEMGAQAVVLFTKCHYGLSYYNTRVGKRHPGLDFDLFAATAWPTTTTRTGGSATPKASRSGWSRAIGARSA